MIGFTADNSAERNQGIVFLGLCKLHQRERHFKRAGNGDLCHILIHHAELAKFIHAGLEFAAAGVFIEAGYDDADAQIRAVGRGRDDVNCHLLSSLVLGRTRKRFGRCSSMRGGVRISLLNLEGIILAHQRVQTSALCERAFTENLLHS